MYLDTGTMIAIMIALTVSTSLFITTAVQNARLTQSRNAYRTAYLQWNSIMNDTRMKDTRK